MTTDTSINQTAQRVLQVLDLILRHTANGLTCTDICEATNLTAASVSRYVSTLEATGWAERIPETGRIRASVKVAQRALGVLADLDKAQQRLTELRTRITQPV